MGVLFYLQNLQNGELSVVITTYIKLKIVLKPSYNNLFATEVVSHFYKFDVNLVNLAYPISNFISLPLRILSFLNEV